MIYWLSQQLLPHFSAFNVLSYVTMRALLAAITAFAFGVWLAPSFIRWAHRVAVQPVRDDGPKTHLQKPKTPTLGGLLMLGGIVMTCALWGDWQNGYIQLALLVLVTFGAIGLVDDWQKIRGNSSRGMSARIKFLFQSLAAMVALTIIVQGGMVAGYEDIIIPFSKDIVLPFGVAGLCILGYLAIVGSSNAVNLTDGLDGLAIMPAILVSGGLAVYAYASGHAVFAEYLRLPHLPGVHELVIFCAALCGAGLAFLWYNAYPASIFMGDVGALSLGAALGLVAILVRQEIIYILMGGLFVAEALSVILQVGYFKISGGKRLLRMAPLHHHFELEGWRENQVVVRFWIISLMLVLLGLAGLKIR